MKNASRMLMICTTVQLAHADVSQLGPAVTGTVKRFRGVVYFPKCRKNTNSFYCKCISVQRT